MWVKIPRSLCPILTERFRLNRLKIRVIDLFVVLMINDEAQREASTAAAEFSDEDEMSCSSSDSDPEWDGLERWCHDHR